MTAAKTPPVLTALRHYLSDYCHFADPQITVPLSFWIAATYIFEAFDAFPYLVITAKVKRAGKTRLSELMGFTSNMPFSVAGATAPALFAAVKDTKPTVFWDEAETLNSEANTLVRAFLNVGYRKGQTIPRFSKSGVIQWPTYCPKVFVLIGDVYDTLRDRSIIVEMQRGEPVKRFLYETAKAEGLELADELRTLLAAHVEKINLLYASVDLPFLTDRDEEIWRPLFAIAGILDHASLDPMRRIAADLASEKTNPYRYVENRDSETVAASEEYAKLCLRDLAAVLAAVKPHGRKGDRAISSNDAVTKLKEIPTSPWRKFYACGSSAELQGNGRYNATSGLTMQQLSDFMRIYGVVAKLIRRGDAVFRGYSAADVEAAARKEGVK